MLTIPSKIFAVARLRRKKADKLEDAKKIAPRTANGLRDNLEPSLPVAGCTVCAITSVTQEKNPHAEWAAQTATRNVIGNAKFGMLSM